MRKHPNSRTPRLLTAAMVAGSAALGLFVAWQAPGLERYGRDWLVRVRGPVPVSADIAIVSIDDASIARLGAFPWSRSLVARAVDAISAGQPKAIALDILFTDPATQEADQALAAAIGRAGNVVAGAELTGGGVYGGEARWLAPLPAIAASAASTAHVNVGTESDGTARQVLFEQSDDAGNTLRALPFEVFRVGNRIPPQAIVEGSGHIVIGPLAIPVEPAPDAVSGKARTRRAARMTIDYAGPSGAFAAQQYSIADVLDGKIPAGALRGKYVLVGATAASLGERFVSPFTHYADAQGNEHGASIPGVEVLANALNTVVRGRFYSEMPGLVALLWVVFWAWVMIALRGVWAQAGVVAIGLAVVLGGSYFCFAELLVFPPLVASLVAFGSAGLAGFAERSFSASAELDRGIRRVLDSLRSFGDGPDPDAVAESIVRLTGVGAARIVLAGRERGKFGDSTGMTLRRMPLSDNAELELAYQAFAVPAVPAMRLAVALARAAVETTTAGTETGRGPLPDSLEDKAADMVTLNDQISRQAEFFHSSMRAVEDGLLIAGPDGRIRFANPRAGAILDLPPDLLAGRDLFAQLAQAEAAALLGKLVLDRQTVERELVLRSHRYTLRLAPVLTGNESQDPVIGIVASLADVTRQHELAQTRSDVVTLVSHEMRTPLTAIQGMTELLANYEIEPVRRREMTLAINDEVKRLARMIGDYLDIARLETGKTPLRLVPVRVETVVERSLLLFEHLANEKSIRLTRKNEANLPPILGDADLLARVFGNLVSNAIKYSPAGTEVSVAIRTGDGGLVVEVEDQGYGIPECDRERVFEKFYRVPRLQDADVPGTGLGLSFVREIVELHGGKVTVRGAVGGKSAGGSVFTIWLPGGGK